MSLSSPHTLVTADHQSQPVQPDSDGFELDMRIVEAGPVAAALLGDTDDGCDTVKGSDC